MPASAKLPPVCLMTPTELPPDNDDFAVLFPQGAEASVEWPLEVRA